MLFLRRKQRKSWALKMIEGSAKMLGKIKTAEDYLKQIIKKLLNENRQLKQENEQLKKQIAEPKDMFNMQNSMKLQNLFSELKELLGDEYNELIKGLDA